MTEMAEGWKMTEAEINTWLVLLAFLFYALLIYLFLDSKKNKGSREGELNWSCGKL